MPSEINISHNDIEFFKRKALSWASAFETACYFDSNKYSDHYSAFDVLIAAGSVADIRSQTGENAFDDLQAFISGNPGWILGYLSYDLKNETESLTSGNEDQLGFPHLHFFVPQHLIIIRGNDITISSASGKQIIEEIEKQNAYGGNICVNADMKSRFSRDEYIQTVNRLKEHILHGDIYEINFCQEFFAEHADIDPLLVFNELNAVSPTPYATFFKSGHHFILSATPERFLSKRDTKLITQPVKGTARRGKNPVEDEMLKNALRNDEKELAENVMIVDLVRNDLARCAVPGTVCVEELFGIYSFEQVHQMISTVVCEVDRRAPVTELIKAAFPMGSMTGAPKVSAMKLIEKYEHSKRGVFSGAVGYFSPSGDFDFNVVIRTILYNSKKKYLSYQVGSAIIYSSDPEKEYEECLLKAEAIRRVLEKKGAEH